MYISYSYLRLFEDNVVVTDDSESYIKTDNDSIVRTRQYAVTHMYVFLVVT